MKLVCKIFGCKLKEFTTVQNIEIMYKQYTTKEVVCVRCGKILSSDTIRTL